MTNRRVIWVTFICLFTFSTEARPDAVAPATEHDTSSHSSPGNSMFLLDNMCGPNCIWQIAKAFGMDCNFKSIAELAGTDVRRGTTVKGIVNACKKIGLPAEAVKTNLRKLARDSRVAILLLDTGDIMHYVILDRIGEDQVRLLDAHKSRNISVKELQSMWNGYAILIGHHEGQRADCTHWSLGTGLQISGLLILLAVTIYGVRFLYLLSTKRQ